MKCILALFALAALTSGASAQSTTTLVDQLQSYLNYELNELAEYGAPPTCGSNCYHYYRSARLSKQLAAAIAAQNAGTPLAPIMNAYGIAPIWDANGIAIPGTGATAPTGGTGGTTPSGGAAISGATGANAR